MKNAWTIKWKKTLQTYLLFPLLPLFSIATAFLAFGVPVAVFNIPIFLYLLGRFVVGNVAMTFQAFGLFVLLPLLLMPQKYTPWVLQSWLAITVLKYFSWRYVIEEFPNPNRPRILVGPPHGVFP